jgi:Spy/CpxP family protein refolding chaperone
MSDFHVVINFDHGGHAAKLVEEGRHKQQQLQADLEEARAAAAAADVKASNALQAASSALERARAAENKAKVAEKGRAREALKRKRAEEFATAMADGRRFAGNRGDDRGGDDGRSGSGEAASNNGSDAARRSA